jgi:hypothetical protein
MGIETLELIRQADAGANSSNIEDAGLWSGTQKMLEKPELFLAGLPMQKEEKPAHRSSPVVND